MTANKRIVFPGGNGFLGRLLADYFINQNHEVIILTRRRQPDYNRARQVPWDGATLGDWAKELEGALAVLNLAGRSVNCRYNEHNRLGLGGAQGNGRQFVSWIHQADFCRAITWLLEHDDFTRTREPRRAPAGHQRSDDADAPRSLWRSMGCRPAGHEMDAGV